MLLTESDIAHVAHEAHRTLAALMGSPDPLPDWVHTGEEARAEAVANVKARVLNHTDTAPQAHDRWLERRVDKGWRIGPKNRAAKTHPNLVPFVMLPESAKAQGYLFHAVVRELSPYLPQRLTAEQKTEESLA